ncbi:helix-turn-helix transcriptional regulator [Paenibacillus sp.]|uniref:helix-turn-helix transcriptional regulator n=1 Tax=Paenibacillus sp. TaxID=58172 RepID=UPI002D403CA6|nr:helix-turn-helix transcriptional regulator [Paenibacillus sp.]HZG86384.1 helix-turn-helix transcriptional regulator [Paenibacillus sp.]
MVCLKKTNSPEVNGIELTARQLEIVDIVTKHAPITGDQIAEKLGVSKPTIRSDLAILAMLGYVDAKPKVGYFAGSAFKDGGRPVSPSLHLKVRDIQGVPVVVQGAASVYDAVVTMFLENVGTLIVADAEGHLEGIVSRKDLLKVTITGASAQTMPIHLVMTRHPNIVTASPDDTVLEAARKMIHHQVDSLPVVEPVEGGKQRVLGRITKTHMTRVLAESAAEGGLTI